MPLNDSRRRYDATFSRVPQWAPAPMKITEDPRMVATVKQTINELNASARAQTTITVTDKDGEAMSGTVDALYSSTTANSVKSAVLLHTYSGAAVALDLAHLAGIELSDEELI